MSSSSSTSTTAAIVKTESSVKVEIQINAEKFYQRLQRLIDHWQTQKSTIWGNSDAICIPFGTREDDSTTYSKSSAIHLYLLGYEITDAIIIITKNSFWFMASEKKCGYLETALANKSTTIQFHTLKRTKDEGMNREHFNALINVMRKGTGTTTVGSLYKSEQLGTFIPAWMNVIEQSQVNKFEITPAVSLFLSIKDEFEIDMCKRAAVLSNKVMKHGFVAEMENILDNDVSIKHDVFATKIEKIILEPTKIGVKVTADAVDVCFTPIIQSGGKYDIKVSAQSNSDKMSSDVIICSLGARYRGYCANVSRTFMVDAPKKVENTYTTLLGLYDHLLEQIIPGNEMKDVFMAAKNYLTKKDATLLPHLPKTFGFVIGLEFRDSNLVLNDKNTTKFEENMIVNVSLGFHNVPLTDMDKKELTDETAAKKLDVFSLLVADTIRVMKDAAPEILTKISREFGDVSYSIADKGDNDEGEDDDEEADDDDDDKKGNSNKKKTVVGSEYDKDGKRSSTRAKEERAVTDQAAKVRATRQQELMKKKIDQALKKLSSTGDVKDEDDTLEEAVDFRVYNSIADFPKELNSNQMRVDFEKEAIFFPIQGRSVPFHVSTIKSITKPEEDKSTWMRVNFYIPGSMTKDIPKNMQLLIMKYGDENVFIKELTFRSLSSKNMVLVHQQYQELKKRIKQREQKVEQEKDLVIQGKLIRIKDQRVPRLQDLTMRPQMSGRKCVGNIEAHQNGLRFTSTKGETLDIMYSNIKHAIYQPCDKTTMVLVHFHLKDFIMIGKKKQKDVQFFTEVIDSSMNLESARRSSYDPDELDEEQREREMRKRLNIAFKEFCLKIEKVAAHYSFQVEIDVPFRKSGFEGNCHKEMVFLQPTTHCLVNLTENPPFVLTLNDIEHVHFERVTYATKNFDLTFIFKNLLLPPRTITAIDMKYMDIIQDWLSLVEITYTMGARSMNWNDTMAAVREEGDSFYMEVDDEGEKKPVGWLFLSGDATDDEQEEEEDDDESFDSAEAGSEDEESEDDSDDDDDSEYADDDDDDDGEEEEDEDEEAGKTWEELERDAVASDKAKRAVEEKERDDPRAKKIQKRR